MSSTPPIPSISSSSDDSLEEEFKAPPILPIPSNSDDSLEEKLFLPPPIPPLPNQSPKNTAEDLINSPPTTPFPKMSTNTFSLPPLAAPIMNSPIISNTKTPPHESFINSSTSSIASSAAKLNIIKSFFSKIINQRKFIY